MTENRPLCFVLMPFGRKPDPAGQGDIDFDALYDRAIEPGVDAAGLVPVRADREQLGGVIHKAMFERLLLCEFAVADLTTANANVFYELGIRHAVRAHTTLPIFASHQRVPFDVSFVRALPYTLGEHNQVTDAVVASLRESLTARLVELRGVTARQAAADSPLFELVREYQPPDVARLKTDVFRERVDYARALKDRLREARQAPSLDELDAIRGELGDLDGVEAGVVIDLYLSYRAKKAWDAMVSLHDAMPEMLRRTVLVREQLALALNRRAGDDPDHPDRARAQAVLEGVIEQQGPSSETNGLLGRIHKDRFVIAKEAGSAAAGGHLRQAIEAYVEGFEADWRDAYPGVNAVTLLEVQGTADALARKERLLPVVRFAVEQSLRGTKADYWDHATLLELAALAGDADRAREHLEDALAMVREPWEPETTANNLRLIRRAWAEREVDGVVWLDEVLDALESRSA
ncbi:MAG: TRAFs-binding domain-containing protein [Sandaracinaceae bacterium]